MAGNATYPWFDPSRVGNPHADASEKKKTIDWKPMRCAAE
jgi:hypothetical protein